MYGFTVQSCPHCRMPLEIQLFGLGSSLGPAEINCLKCGDSIATGRIEWPEMSIPRKLWLLVVTLIYVVMLGLLTGNFLDQAAQLWNRDPVVVNLRYEAAPFRNAACAGGIAAILLQAYRVVASRRRFGAEHKLTISEFLFGVQWNLQIKCLLLLLMIWGAAKVISEI